MSAAHPRATALERFEAAMRDQEKQTNGKGFWHARRTRTMTLLSA
jgi:hypothetical protein